MPRPIRVQSLHLYPVKSLVGETVTQLDLDERGCVGDRLWGVRTADGKIGSGKSTRRFRAVLGLLELRAARQGERVGVTFPDGSTYFTDATDAAAKLSEHIGEPLTFVREADVSHYDDGPVSLIGTASVQALADERGADVSPQRFRPNILLDTEVPMVEESWIDGRVAIGSVVLEVALRSPRCVMVDMKTADLPAQPVNLLAAGRLNDSCLGVIARVVEPGRISVGDEVRVV